MGIYAILCSACGKAFTWFSGNPEQLCPDCIKKTETKTDKEPSK